jgi:ABC-2 type transport system ATP-binding protein
MIHAKNIHKSYGNIHALKGISLNIEKGEFFGLLGPNGAGKTTCLNILSTLINADQGNIEIRGRDTRQDPEFCKQSIGFVPQEISLYEDLSAWENLMFWRGLYGVSKAKLKEKALEVLGMMGLNDRKDHKIKYYSGGMKRRINIACALLHSPPIIFMDEPTVGIDPQSRNFIYEFLKALSESGLTIIYTTHYMQEVELLCNRIGIIDDGEIISRGSLAELQKKHSKGELIYVQFQDKAPFEKLRKELSYEIHQEGTDGLVFKVNDSGESLTSIIEHCNNGSHKVRNLEIRKPNLETIFLSLTGKKLRDE